ncbi:VTC domain-containing protein [Acetitomaculum ruminis DSM 5522]|uniref:VTC domain-containing protein n=1 Tax=Acetitomaculum ruminis DSM 5522 TaxID=1120918 RepID=A0A1I0XY79_9FIRM|nr:polyphosphate polymerase domain-containing protein [Acetitomaculum ruminis]SFB06089.1 VTC domain-containing protein [Acetitomaculum ruminis DSM 5522]
MADLVFNRYEKKYKISLCQYKALLEDLDKYMVPDKFGKYTVCNLYYDTDNFDLIRNSLEKPVYKEKLRLRSYKTINNTDNVFLEIKKKYKKVVNKRRIVLPYKDACSYLSQGGRPENVSPQILKEIDYFLNRFDKLEAKTFLAYDRLAFAGKEDSKFRVTFDSNIRFRNYDLCLDKGDYGKTILKNEEKLMEIKINQSIPLWFVQLLNEYEIYPTSFSKYGRVYQDYLFYDSFNRYSDKENTLTA